VDGDYDDKNLKTNKAISIEREIGKYPVLAFGNSGGDMAMGNYTLDNPHYQGAAFMLLCDNTELDYGDLGILTWLEIPDEELKKLLEEFSALMNAEKNRELLHTLRVYLENNMNYSLTAEKLYVNINTIRRRIEKVNELVDVDWNNYYTRAKIGLMLQFMQF
jgi:hypothetical protein